jgi:hypothetical protein
MSNRLRTLAIGLVALATVGCGTRVGNSNGGSGNTGPAPLVVITPIGHKATSAAGANPVTLTVRSGADVTLSGKDSDGVSVALKTFEWSQSGGASLPSPPDVGALLYRTSNTVSFRAPAVATPTKLSFKLTVTNALGGSASATADVSVVPANDSDQFLVPSTKPRTFQVGVTTVDGIDKSTLSADVPLCVRVARQVQYQSRDGIVHDPIALPQLASLQADTAWSKSASAAAAKDSSSGTLSDTSVSTSLQSFSNPRVTFEVPSFNDDELFAMFSQPGAGSAQFAQQLVPSDVDTAHLLLSISATPGSCDGKTSAPALATKLVVAVLDSAQKTPFWNESDSNGSAATITSDTPPTDVGTGSVPASLTADTLLSKLSTIAQVETAESMKAYYAAIDPDKKRTTLNDWLDANCFDHTAADYGVAAAGANAAHATYTNNFDLGFGRDMYVMNCAATNTLASVVINYPSLETAALKQGPIIAVAMEYGVAADGSNPDRKFAKFYVFAPDDRDGLLKRVGGANFDHRGQKYVPGACTSCHGGTLPTLPPNFVSSTTPYPVIQDPRKDQQAGAANKCSPATPTAACLSSGDVDAAFLPWDLDSFLYADTDPAYTGRAIPKTGFQRADQEPHLKAMNQLVHLTFEPEMEPQAIANGSGPPTTVIVDRYDAARSLVEGWYGGTGFPNPTYSDAGPPAAWTSWAAPAASAGLYHNVFARNCRACHSVNPQVSIQFTGANGYTDFINEFTAAGSAASTNASGGKHIGQQYVFQQAVMPAARLTTDRFWVDYGGGDSAAKTLAVHLSQAIGATNLVTSSGDAVAPGQPSITVTVNGHPADATTGQFTADRFAGARVESSASFFAASYKWTLCISPTQGGTCVAAPLIGDTTSSPGIDTSAFGYYTLTLVADNGLGQTVTPTYTIHVPDSIPALVLDPTTHLPVSNCPAGKSAQFDLTNDGAAVPIDVAACFAPPGDPPYTLKISADGTSYSAGPITGPNGGWKASVVPGALPSITFNFTVNADAMGANTVHYQWCDLDSECATGSTTVGLSGALKASSAPIIAYYDPRLNPNNTGGTSLTIPAGAQSIYSSNATAAFVSLGTLQNDMTLGVPADAAVGLALSLTPATAARGALSATSLTGTSVADLRTKISALTFTPKSDATSHCVNLDVLGNPLAAGAAGVCASTANVSNTLTSGGTTSATGTAPVTVRALASFSQAASPTQESIYAIMTETGSCATGGCHLKTNPSTMPAVLWFVTANPNNGSTTYLDDTYTSATQTVIGTPPNAIPLVIPGDPLGSLLYTVPCRDGYNGNAMLPVYSITDPQCHILYQWILEGAGKN